MQWGPGCAVLAGLSAECTPSILAPSEHSTFETRGRESQDQWLFPRFTRGWVLGTVLHFHTWLSPCVFPHVLLWRLDPSPHSFTSLMSEKLSVIFDSKVFGKHQDTVAIGENHSVSVGGTVAVRLALQWRQHQEQSAAEHTASWI